jgi:hypothetical protein
VRLRLERRYQGQPKRLRQRITGTSNEVRQKFRHQKDALDWRITVIDDTPEELAFLQDWVLPNRGIHLVRYSQEGDNLDTAVMLDHQVAGISVMILPTLVDDVLHLALHCFSGGSRYTPQIDSHPDGVTELTIRAYN